MRPKSIMGKSKRISELIIKSFDKLNKTETLSKTKKGFYGAVRFGNVLGSSGSVLPRFNEQIKKEVQLQLHIKKQ